MEDGEEFYAYDISHAIAEYEELAEMSRELYKLKDYQIFLACNPLKETVLFQEDSEYTKYVRKCLSRDYGLEETDREEFARKCRRYVYLWRRSVKKIMKE